MKTKLDNISRQRMDLEKEAQSLHKQLQQALSTNNGTNGSASASDELQSYRAATESSLRKQQHQIE